VPGWESEGAEERNEREEPCVRREARKAEAEKRVDGAGRGPGDKRGVLTSHR
jgi:hypothetical protein